MNVMDRVALGTEMIAAAGRIALDILRAPHMAVEAKGPGDLVSAADFAIEAMMRQRIGAAFPEDAIIGEEDGGRANAEGFTWLIDPIDGTVNYARRLGYFCISLALVEGVEPRAAWVLDPLQDEQFHAGPDRVMRVNGTPTRCSGETRIGEAVFGLGFSSRHGADLPQRVVAGITGLGAEHRRLGAGALCLAHVAAGRLEGYLEPHMNPWDAVGGLYLAACAGALTGPYLTIGGLETGAPVIALVPSLAETLLAQLPAPFSGTPLHREMSRGVPD